MKRAELESIKMCVSAGDYTVLLHSYGTYGKGYLVNYRLIITDKVHEQLYNRNTYYLCFSADTWYKVKYTGTIYNYNWHDKYAQYDEEIEKVIFNRHELAKVLVR